MEIKPTLTSLRAFDLAARLGSFTEAAKILNVTRPAVSKQVKELENVIGCQLINRSGPHVSLTKRGKELAAGLLQGFDAISMATRRVIDSGQKSQSVRVLVERDFASSWLAQKIGTFLVEHPGISVEVIAERNGRLRIEEDFSFRIFYGRPGELCKDDLEEVFLCDWIDIPLCTAEYAQQHITSDGRYNGAHFLLDKNYNPWEEWFRQAGIENPGTQAAFTSFNETTLCLSAALAGAGITIGDSFLCLKSIEEGSLIAPYEVGLRSKACYSIFQPTGRIMSASEVAFQRWLFQAIEEFERRVERVFGEKGIEVI